MQTKSKGLVFIGAVFFVLGICCCAIAISPASSSLWMSFISAGEQGVVAAYDASKVLEAEKEQSKLKASGKLEQFNKEYSDFKKEFTRLREEYKASLPARSQFSFLIYLFAGLVFLIAGIGLIVHKSWGRYLAFLSIFNLCFLYILFWYQTYPILFMIDFMRDRMNALNLLIDPIDPAYRVLSKYAGEPTLKSLLFTFPANVCHLAVIAIAVATLYYLSSPKAKAHTS